MKNVIAKVHKDPFIRNSLVYFSGLLIVAVVNYLYYPVMSRVLSVEDFGEVQVIATIVLQMTIILNVFGYITINIFANTKNTESARKRIKELEGAALVIVAGLSLVALIFSAYIDAYLKFSSVMVLLALAAMFILNVPFTIKNGWLQANNKFIDMSLAQFISAVFKLILALPLIYIGITVNGALFGLVFATLLSLVYVSYRAGINIKIRDHLGKNYFKLIFQDEKLKRDLWYGLLIFLALFSINLLYSGDVIIVRRFFSETDAGLYSGIASIGRIIFFSTFAIAAVLMPSIKIAGKSNENVKNLKKALFISLFLGGIILAAFFVSPQLVIRTLIGKNYLPYSPLLSKVGLFVLLASILNVLFVYGIALRKMFISIIGPAAAVLVFVVSYTNNRSVDAVINNFILVNSIALVVTGVYLAATHKKPAKITQPASA